MTNTVKQKDVGKSMAENDGGWFRLGIERDLPEEGRIHLRYKGGAGVS